MPVPKVGGAPAVVGVVGELAGGASLRQAVAVTSRPRGACSKNCRRVFIEWGAYSHLLTGASRSAQSSTGKHSFQSALCLICTPTAPTGLSTSLPVQDADRPCPGHIRTHQIR